MPEVLARSLPGFRFVSEPPPLREFLPRMDIAVFVGFASSWSGGPAGGNRRRGRVRRRLRS